MRIEVTKQDIHDGKMCDRSLCPVALAITRHLPPDLRCAVGESDVAFMRDDRDVLAMPLPQPVIDWIAAYDWGDLEPEPIGFELPIEELTGAAA